MNGRQEHTLKIEQKILRDLKNDPKVLQDFYCSMTNKTATTKKNYIAHVRKFLKKADFDYMKAKKADIQRYMESIRYRKNKDGELIENTFSNRNVKLCAVSCFYDFLVDSGELEKNPCDGIKLPKTSEDKEIVAMTGEEVNHVIKTIEKENTDEFILTKVGLRDLTIFTLGCVTGLRVSAISEINIEDIHTNFINGDDDMDEMFYSIDVIEKRNRRRTVYLDRRTSQTMRRWVNYRLTLKNRRHYKTRALFLTKTKGGDIIDRRISVTAIRDMIAKYTKDLNKHITPHKMRSTCATLIYENTHDIYMVKSALGHDNISSTMRYTRQSKNDKIKSSMVVSGEIYD